MPIKHLTITDGLPQNTINFITQDEKGFFWIGTNGGLSRYDGYEFVNFTQADGLPSNLIFDFLKTDDQNIWLATKSGLVKFNPEGTIYNRAINFEESKNLSETPMFTTYYLPGDKTVRFTKILQSSSGAILIGTENGLYRVKKNENEDQLEAFDLGLAPNADKFIYGLYEDRRGAIWVGTTDILTRISASGRIEHYSEKPGAVYNVIVEDSKNRLWVGTNHRGLFEFGVDENETPQLVKQYAEKKDSEVEWIDTISESADGRLWLGGVNGLHQFDPESEKLYRYTRSSGLDYNRLQTSFEDKNGNLWLGTRANGIYRLLAEGLISFETEDRISFIRSIGFDKDKNLLLTGFLTNTSIDEKGAKVLRDISGQGSPPSEWHLGVLDKNGFRWTIPKFPKKIDFYGWGENQLSLQSRRGEWWIVTGEGLYRFPAVAFNKLNQTLPIQVFNEQNGLNSGGILHIFEDSQGSIWIASETKEGSCLFKWERTTEKIVDLSNVEGFSAIRKDFITSFAEDRRGNIWLSLYFQGFARLYNGKLDLWNAARGVPSGGAASLFFDSGNRLWVAMREKGILRVDRTDAEQLNFINYTDAHGLSSSRTFSIAQDNAGLIYIGTDRDVNIFNPQTARFRNLRLSRNQAQREFRSAICDKSGNLWFGTTEGLVKYEPSPEKFSGAPEILITGASVESAAQKIPATGTKELNLPTLASDQNQVRINFVSLSAAENEDINYQYKLNDDNDWSLPSRERFVNFANLSAGKYQILIRAVAPDGSFSANPAIVSFRVLPPIYLRWWFLAAVALVIAAAIYALYRFRVQKLLEIERTRTFIATDLHDDIGSNLSKISVLSEVVRMQLAQEGKSDNKLLGSIAEISRESVSSMSDIVWAINPKRDSALEMARKMREYAEELFVPKGVSVEFFEPDKSAKIKFSMDLRRDIYLIFKEAINNIAKHSECRAVKIIFDIRHSEIILRIEDDGIGFDAGQQTTGNGLVNMKNRVEKLKGYFQINSRLNQGTDIIIRIPQN